MRDRRREWGGRARVQGKAARKRGSDQSGKGLGKFDREPKPRTCRVVSLGSRPPARSHFVVFDPRLDDLLDGFDEAPANPKPPLCAFGPFGWRAAPCLTDDDTKSVDELEAELGTLVAGEREPPRREWGRGARPAPAAAAAAAAVAAGGVPDLALVLIAELEPFPDPAPNDIFAIPVCNSPPASSP